MPLLPVHNTLGKRCKKQPDFTPFLIFVANGVKKRVFCHRFSMALYFHDQCQNDSKTQHVLSGKWWVFTDKWSVTHFCPGKGRFLRTKVYVFEPGFPPPDPEFYPWPIYVVPDKLRTQFTLSRDFTLPRNNYEPAEPQIPIYDKCPSFS